MIIVTLPGAQHWPSPFLGDPIPQVKPPPPLLSSFLLSPPILSVYFMNNLIN